MKANHIKYTVEFDVPIKIDDSKMNPNAFNAISSLLEHAIKTQVFYFTKEGIPPSTMRAKNIKVAHEVTLQDYQI